MDISEITICIPCAKLDRRCSLHFPLEQLAAVHSDPLPHPRKSVIEMAGPLTTTFGVELEFICVYPQGFFRGLFPEYDGLDQAGNAIEKHLRQIGIEITGFEYDEDIFAPQPEGPTYSRWTVSREELHLSRAEQALLPPGSAVEALELSSRVFRLDRDNWRLEIEAVVATLRMLERCGCRIFANGDTGLHVHVGNGDASLPLETSKNVFRIVTAFEHCLDLIHTAPRIKMPSPDDTGTIQCASPSFFFSNRILPSADAQPSVCPLRTWLAAIDGVDEYEQLGGFFSGTTEGSALEYLDGHNSAYNFDNLYSRPGVDRKAQLTQTIEFRQHAGTLVLEDIIAWILTVTRIVEFAHKSYATDRQLISTQDLVGDEYQLPESKDFGLVELLTSMGVADEAINIYRRKIDSAVDFALGEKTRKLVLELELEHYQTFYPLMEEVEKATYARSGIAAVQEAVRRKYEAGHYGLEPN